MIGTEKTEPGLDITELQPPAEGRRTWIWPALSCSVVLACILVSNPFNESGFCDDWSYGHVAMKLAQTGHLQYNGWGNPLILFQTLWAVPWIRLFGFSFHVLAASMVPISLGFVLMVYAVGREIGLRPSLAAFGATTIGTCPLFMILAGTFMTDACGCLFSFLSIYAALKCAHAKKTATAVAWVWWLSLAGLVGGANRQVVWIAPLTLIPYLFWLYRADPRFRVHAAAAYGVCLAAILVLLHYFSQPFSPMLLTHRQTIELLHNEGLGAALLMMRFLAMSVLLAGPGFCCLLPLLRRKPIPAIIILLLTSISITFAQIILTGILAPYGNSMLTAAGPVMMPQDIFQRPALLPIWLRLVLTYLGNFCILAVPIGCAKDWFGALRRHRAFQIFAIFSLANVALLVPGALTGFAFDRHMLPVIGLLILGVLQRFSCHGRRIPLAACGCFVFFAFYGVATTHDYFASLRARAAAAHLVENTGVSRDHVGAGFEYDAWTEVTLSGTVRVAQYQDRFANDAPKGFWFEFWDHTPHIHPDYVVLNLKEGERPLGAISTVQFHTWLAPRRRMLVVWRRSDLTSVFQALRLLPSQLGGS